MCVHSKISTWLKWGLVSWHLLPSIKKTWDLNDARVIWLCQTSWFTGAFSNCLFHPLDVKAQEKRPENAIINFKLYNDSPQVPRFLKPCFAIFEYTSFTGDKPDLGKLSQKSSPFSIQFVLLPSTLLYEGQNHVFLFHVQHIVHLNYLIFVIDFFGWPHEQFVCFFLFLFFKQIAFFFEGLPCRKAALCSLESKAV